MGNLTAKTSGEIASFMTPAKTNIKSLKVHFSPKQLGTGDPSPENVREIVGWDGVEVNGSGKNLWNNEDIIYGYWTDSNGKQSKNQNGCRTQYIHVASNTTIQLFYYGVQPYSASIIELNYNKEFIKRTHIAWAGVTNPKSLIITTSNETRYIYAQIYIYTSGSNIKMTYDVLCSYKMQMEFNTITSYKPYQGNNISYQWKLPDEYQEVEYIESTGTQYIKTNYTPQNFDSIKCLFSMSEFYTSGSTYWTLFSAGTDTYQLIVLLAKSGVSGAYYKYFASGTASKFNFNPKIDTKYEMNVDSNGIISCNDYTAQSNYQNAVDTPLYLMMRVNGESPFKGKIYKFSIINNGINMINLVPCYRKSDDEIGMYDTISQTFYTNQGTGTFLKGDDVDKTFYGGYVDLISGELVEEYSYLNLSNLNWNITSQVSVFRSDDLINYYVSNITNFICNKYITTSRASTSITNMEDLNIKAHDVNDKYIYIKDTNYTDVTEFKSSLIDCNIVYLLAIPITHQLTPTQLQSFVGQNNFWSNADYVEIEYDLKETEDIQKARKKIILNQPHIESIKDNSISFNTDLRAPLKECKVYFEPVQEGEGDPSPENVRNITGWNRVEVKNGDNIYSIDWINDIGTVYGGYVDLVKGELVAEWSEKMINSFDWSYNSSGECFRASADIKRKSINAISPIQSKIYKTTKVYNSISYWSNVDDFSISEHTGANSQGELINSIHIKDSRYTTVSDFLNGVGNESVIYELETPIHYSLTPQQILSLKGINNFSCGIKNNLSVRYWNYKKSNSSNIAYEAKNLTFDGTNYIDTGVYLFSEKNINRDFEVVIEDLYGGDPSNLTIVCAKYDSTAIGFLIRNNGNSSTIYNGTISMKRDNYNNITIKRVNGAITISGSEITNPKVKFTNAVHQHPLVLGCALQDDGTPFRYATGTIGHITVKWL